MRNSSWKVLRIKNSLSCCGMAEEKKEGLTKINPEHFIGEKVMMYCSRQHSNFSLYHRTCFMHWSSNILRQIFLCPQGTFSGRYRSRENKEKDPFVTNWNSVKFAVIELEIENYFTLLYSRVLMDLVLFLCWHRVNENFWWMPEVI